MTNDWMTQDTEYVIVWSLLSVHCKFDFFEIKLFLSCFSQNTEALKNNKVNKEQCSYEWLKESWKIKRTNPIMLHKNSESVHAKNIYLCMCVEYRCNWNWFLVRTSV